MAERFDFDLTRGLSYSSGRLLSSLDSFKISHSWSTQRLKHLVLNFKSLTEKRCHCRCDSWPRKYLIMNTNVKARLWTGTSQKWSWDFSAIVPVNNIQTCKVGTTWRRRTLRDYVDEHYETTYTDTLILRMCAIDYRRVVVSVSWISGWRPQEVHTSLRGLVLDVSTGYLAWEVEHHFLGPRFWNHHTRAAVCVATLATGQQPCWIWCHLKKSTSDHDNFWWTNFCWSTCIWVPADTRCFPASDGHATHIACMYQRFKRSKRRNLW